MLWLLKPHRTRIFQPGETPETRCAARWIEGVLRFEFCFVSPVVLIGNARDGWSDISGATEQFLEWSETANSDGRWQQRQFEPTHAEILLATGNYEYRARSIHPLSGTAAKSSQFARLGVHFHKSHRNFR